MKEALANYINRIKELADHVRGNEQATRSSLIGPLFTMLGYDLTDPRQCIPEYKVDFGRERSSKPIDWAFLQNGRPLFFVEAKEAGKKLLGYDEQLADYFAKAPEVKLGILTNGVHWRFFTDLENSHVMDKEPFVKWDVLNDEQPPIEFLTILQKSDYNSGLLRTYAERSKKQSELIRKLNTLLEPSPEFTKLVITGFETRNLTAPVVDSWKSIVASAISEWAKQRQLSSVIDSQVKLTSQPTQTAGEESGSKQVETTQEELDAFALIQRLLGPARPVAYEDSRSYFKIHLPDRPSWVMCRLQLGRKRSSVWVPLPKDQLGTLPAAASVALDVQTNSWSIITFETAPELSKLGHVFQAAWDAIKSAKSKSPE